MSYVCFGCAVSCHGGLVDDRFIQAIVCYGAVGLNAAVAVWGLWLDWFLQNLTVVVLNYCFNAFYATVTDLKCVAVKILCSWLDFGKWLSISFKKNIG